MKIGKTHFTIPLLLALLLELILAFDLASQITEKQKYWVNIFPIGMKIYSFEIDPQNPNTIYASTYKGLFKSNNGGKLWIPINILDELTWGIVKINPVLPKTLFYGISQERGSGSIWKSEDGGVNWEDISAGIINNSVYDIAINPKSPEIIYVATGGGLFKTFNGGKTWGKIADAYSIFLNSERPDEIYTTLMYTRKGNFRFEDNSIRGLYYSINGGQSFELVNQQPVYMDLYGKEVYAEVYNPILNPHTVKEIFVNCWNNPVWHFLKSSDNCNTWIDISPKEFLGTDINLYGKKVDNYANLEVTSIGFDPNAKDIIFISTSIKKAEDLGPDQPDKIFKSIDGGMKWLPLPIPSQMNINNIKVPLQNTIYVSTDCGIYKTTNDGKDWELRSFGLPTKIGDRELKLVDTKSEVIYVGSNNGYWVSNNRGLSWEWNSFPLESFGKFSNTSILTI